jgi:23S rRNA (cytidine1920-2'-O)/16S rRNA (cytidine1409-2'-O)-methyltransferase
VQRPRPPVSRRAALAGESRRSMLCHDRPVSRAARPSRLRLDQLLVERGLVETRTRAQALVMAGKVRVGEGDAARTDRKPGDLLDTGVPVEVVEPQPYVSRGGLKLAAALDAFRIDPREMFCLDVGASTGGFTDVLLQRGAARVIALDVGYGQLHPRIRRDPRVTVLERVNVREVRELPFRPELVVCDVSFVSVRKALPPALALAAPGWEAVVLVKPQFEATRGEARRGVVRDRDVHRRVLAEVAREAGAWGAQLTGVVDSGLPGPKGNREFFLHLVQRERPEIPDELQDWIDHATA